MVKLIKSTNNLFNVYLCRFSSHKAFISQLLELNDIAGQHEIVAEEMLSKVNKALLNFCNDLKVEKKKV